MTAAVVVPFPIKFPPLGPVPTPTPTPEPSPVVQVEYPFRVNGELLLADFSCHVSSHHQVIPNDLLGTIVPHTVVWTVDREHVFPPGEVRYQPAPNQFVTSGRRQVSARLPRLVGPKEVMWAFLKRYGDVCKAADNHLTISTRDGVDLVTLRHVVLSQIGLAAAAGDLAVLDDVHVIACDLIDHRGPAVSV
jgi:hypothetical protein